MKIKVKGKQQEENVSNVFHFRDLQKAIGSTKKDTVQCTLLK